MPDLGERVRHEWLYRFAQAAGLVPIGGGVGITVAYAASRANWLPEAGWNLILWSIPLNLAGFLALCIFFAIHRASFVFWERWMGAFLLTIAVLFLNYPIAVVCMLIGGELMFPMGD